MTPEGERLGRDGAPTRIAVVGAGLAGVSACARLRELGYGGRLILFGAEDEPPYDRPPLSKELLLGKRLPSGVRLRPDSWYVDNEVDLRLGVRVTEILAAEGRLALADGGTEPADAVVLATGGRPRVLPVPGARHPALGTLRTLADGLWLRDRLVAGARVGVVGGGLVGAEVAAAARTLGCAVTLIDPTVRPLERAVGVEIADAMQAQHRDNGVRIIVSSVSEVCDLRPAVRLRLRDRTDPVDCDVVVVGVGITADVDLAVRAGLATDGGVLVDADQRTAHPRIFAVGDAARCAGPAGPLLASEHWEAALHEAHAAAGALLGRPTQQRRAPWFWSERYGTHLDVVGGLADAEQTVLRGERERACFTAFAVRAGRCVGAAALNRPLEIKAARRLIERRIPVTAQQLADESVELRSLLRG